MAGKEEHRVASKWGARRKLALWDAEGLEAFLNDDGVDRGEQLSTAAPTKVKVSDLLDKLELKYDLLRAKLFWEMVNGQSSESLFTTTVFYVSHHLVAIATPFWVYHLQSQNRCLSREHFQQRLPLRITTNKVCYDI